jgi:ankyrin repeat protein
MSKSNGRLFWACYNGYKHRILKLANKNNVNYVRPHFGDTPLHHACKQGWLDIVEIFIEKYGCDRNVVTKNNLSPLHYACQCDHIDIVKLLIETYGCDPNVTTESDESLLHYACQCGHVDIVEVLIERYGCDPNVVTKSNESLLHYVCRCDHIDIVIEQYDCDPDVGVTKNNRSLLRYVCRCDCINVVELLIEKYGCDPNVMTKNKENLLHYVCRSGNIDIVKYLINKQHLYPLMRNSTDQLEPLDYAINNNRHCIAVYICQNCISSDEMLNPKRIKTTVNLIKYIISRADIRWPITDHTYRASEDPFDVIWRTADGDNILQLVGSSKTLIAHIPSAVASEMLASHNTKLNCIIVYFKPDLRTADGDTILEVVSQSRRIVSNIDLFSNTEEMAK